MFFKNLFFTNLLILTNSLSFKFLTTTLIIFNLFFFFKTKDILKKLLSTILNLLFLTFLIVLRSNEAFAYLFLITELTGILVVSPILLSKSDTNNNKKNINFNLFYLVLFILLIVSIFGSDVDQKYNIFIDNIKDSNANFNDLYSLFLILNYNHTI